MSESIMNLIFTVVVIPLIGILTKYLVAFFQLKTNELKEKISDERLKKYLKKAEDAIASAVIAVSQTFVDSLKANNTFTRENGKAAFVLAKEKALAIMGEQTLSILKDELKSSEFEIWLDTKIEQYVRINK